MCVMAVLLSKITPEVGMHHWTARNQRMRNHFTGVLIHIFIWKLLLKYDFFRLEQTEYTCSFSRHDCHELKNYNQVLIKILLQAIGILYIHWQRTKQDHYVHAFLYKISAIHSEPYITITENHLWILTYGDHFQNSYAYLLTISSQSSLSKTNKNQKSTTSPKILWLHDCLPLLSTLLGVFCWNRSNREAK